MAIGSIFKSLFGGGKKAEPVAEEPLEYKGFNIVAQPISEGGQFRTAGKISKVVDGELKESTFIRADNNGDRQSAIDHCVYKAKQIIDEQGDSLLQREMV